MSLWDELVSEARSGGFSVLSDRAQDEIISMIDRAMRYGFERGRVRTKAETLAPEMAESLRPFARFMDAVEGLGSQPPREGVLYAVNSRTGKAEITVEMLKEARAILVKLEAE